MFSAQYSRDFYQARPDLAPFIHEDEQVRAKPTLLKIPAFKCPRFGMNHKT